MFGSRIVRSVIYDVLSADQDVTAVVGSRIHHGRNYPQGVRLPALLYYVEMADYENGPITTAAGESIRAQNFRFVVRLDDEGESDERIVPAAKAQLKALNGLAYDTADNEQVTFAAIGEVPMSPYNEDGARYQTLGTVYSVELRR